MNCKMSIKNETGAVSIFVAILFLAFISVLGLINDGSSIRGTRRRLGDITAQASRAGAQEIDIGYLRTFGQVRLDETKAEVEALRILALHGIEGRAQISASQITISAFQFVELWGMREVRVSAQNTSRATTDFLTTSSLNP